MAVHVVIPARAHSERIPGKALKPLGGEPLIGHTIRTATRTGLSPISVCSDDPDLLTYCQQHEGVEGYRRAPSAATEPDWTWIARFLTDRAIVADTDLVILRPTTPFRDADEVCRAWRWWLTIREETDSLRAITRTRAHPGKCWACVSARRMSPSLPGQSALGIPWHSLPTQSLPPIWQQTSGLEIVHTTVILRGSLSGTRIAPWITEGAAAWDLNTLEDWAIAEAMIETGRWTLPA